MNTKLGTFFGIPLYLNLLTPVFALLILLQYDYVYLGVYISGLFFVVLHEYGHCLAGIKRGMVAKDIYILPIGGVARLTYECESPFDEIYVALAGPLVNLSIAVCLMPFLFLFYYTQIEFLFLVCSVFITLNVVMLLFNLLVVVFPMDGGRVLRGLLSYKLGHESATWWAVKSGQTLSLILTTLAFIHGFYFYAVIFAYMIYESEKEIPRSKLSGAMTRLRIKIAQALDSPELTTAPVSKLISSLESIEDEDLKKRLQVTELIAVLSEVVESDSVV